MPCTTHGRSIISWPRTVTSASMGWEASVQIAAMIAALMNVRENPALPQLRSIGTGGQAGDAVKVLIELSTLLLLPASAFCLGLYASASPLDSVLWGVLHGAVRAATGAAMGGLIFLACDHISKGGVPVLSDIWHRDAWLQGHMSMSQATAAALGPPQVQIIPPGIDCLCLKSLMLPPLLPAPVFLGAQS